MTEVHTLPPVLCVDCGGATDVSPRAASAARRKARCTSCRAKRPPKRQMTEERRAYMRNYQERRRREAGIPERQLRDEAERLTQAAVHYRRKALAERVTTLDAALASGVKLLDVTCWCERKTGRWPLPEITAGRTFSCGELECRPPQ